MSIVPDLSWQSQCQSVVGSGGGSGRRELGDGEVRRRGDLPIKLFWGIGYGKAMLSIGLEPGLPRLAVLICNSGSFTLNPTCE